MAILLIRNVPDTPQPHLGIGRGVKYAHGRVVWHASIVRPRRSRCPEARPIRQHACVRIVRRAARTGAQWDTSATINAFVLDISPQKGKKRLN